MPDDVASLLEAIEPYSSRRASHRALALHLASSIPRIADRSALPAHLTASVFAVGGTSEVLLAWHPKFGRWLQPGGHCDGEPDALAVARRELEEETGLADVSLEPLPFDVDIHPGEPGGAPHMHLDVRFVGLAGPAVHDRPLGSPEGLELRWFRTADVDDTYVREAAAAAIAHARRHTLDVSSDARS